jgi:DNA (cytosine-5)-methyltransferase 1
VPTMTYNVTPQLAPNGLTVAELFAGGGLMAVGLRAAGYDLVWANDFDRNAVKAYRHNLGDHIVHGDITAIDPADIPDTDVIAGGPPCQDYSVAGTGAGENGERGKLVWAYLRIIEVKRPKAFIFENVKGLITKKHRPTFDALLAKFEEIGYNVSWRLINAWDYGVAQKRERVFIVGIRNDIGFTYEFPEPSPEDYRTKVLRDVIGDLPEPGIPLTNVQQAFLDRNPLSVAKNRPVTMDEPSRTLPAVLHKGVPYGLFYPPNHVQTQVTTVKPHQRLSNQRGYVADMDGPGRTVNTCRWDHAEIHPQQPRRFTVRECLRIQSVPDWYVLPDDISLSAQYRIVGNGVASRVAYLLGIALAEQFRSGVIGERLRTEVSA